MAASGQMRVAVGLRAQKGGALIVAVRVGEEGPEVLLSTTIATHEPSDRISLEPYRVASEIAHCGSNGALAEAADTVAEGRKRQAGLAEEVLRAVLGLLRERGALPDVAALLVNRAGWVTDLLSYSLAWDEHVPVAELLA